MSIKKPLSESNTENKLTKINAKILRKSVISAKKSNKIFKSGAMLIKDALYN